MKAEAPFGYEWKDGELVINEKDSNIIKWLYEKVLEYTNSPPDFLIKQTINNSEEKLSYDDARERVSLSKIYTYVLAELKVRIQKFENQQKESNEIHEFLKSEFDKELIEAIEEKYRLQYIQ